MLSQKTLKTKRLFFFYKLQSAFLRQFSFFMGQKVSIALRKL